MDASELFNKLKKESMQITHEDMSLARAYVRDSTDHVPEPYKTIYSSDYFVFLYENFLEVRRSCAGFVRGHIDHEEYGSVLDAITKQNDPSDLKKDAFNRFAGIVNIYLTFIARRPLHPVGMVFPGGMRIIEKENDYYCPVKDKQSETGISFCEFCVCRDSNELL